MKVEETSATVQMQHYLYLLKSKMYLMLTCLFLGIGFAAIYAFFVATPKYESTVQMITQTNDAEKTNGGLNDLNANILLVNTYKDMIKSNKLLLEEQKELKNEGIHLTLSEMRQMISLQQSQNSQMFELKVVSDNPQISRLIGETISTIFQKEVKEYSGEERIKIVSPATLAENPVSPNRKLILLIGAVLGLFVSVIFIFLREIVNNTIHSPEFISEEAGVPVLGTISGASEELLEEGKMINFEYYRQNPRQFKKDFYPKRRARRRRKRKERNPLL